MAAYVSLDRLSRFWTKAKTYLTSNYAAKSHTHSAATTSAAGLMSAADKAKANYTNIAYGTCATAAATAAKVISVSGNSNWALTAGSIIAVKFNATNTASNPTFNVNKTGAKSVWYNTALITTGSLGYAGTANRPSMYMYDGTQYIWLGWAIDANNYYTNASLGQGYGTCSTAADTTAKVVTLSSYTLTTGGVVAVKFTYAVPAGATLNINSKGAKAIYYKDAAITAGVIAAGDTATFIYNGSYYHLLTLDRDNNTDTKVTNTLATTTKAYVTGTTSSSTNTGTQVFDTGVYLDTTAGQLTATTFKGALSGNASTATKATQDSAGQQINTTYIKGLSVSGKVITYTRGNGTTGTITTQDTNTTYSPATASANGLMTAAHYSKVAAMPVITVSATEPASPATGDLWAW